GLSSHYRHQSWLVRLRSNCGLHRRAGWGRRLAREVLWYWGRVARVEQLSAHLVRGLAARDGSVLYFAQLSADLMLVRRQHARRRLAHAAMVRCRARVEPAIDRRC